MMLQHVLDRLRRWIRYRPERRYMRGRPPSTINHD
jgi:hypothetical protein